MNLIYTADQHLEHMIRYAETPLAVLFVAGEPDRIHFVRSRFRWAEDVRDLVIPVEINADENPSITAEYAPAVLATDTPQLVIFKGGRVRGRLQGDCTTSEISRLIRQAVRVA